MVSYIELVRAFFEINLNTDEKLKTSMLLMLSRRSICLNVARESSRCWRKGETTRCCCDIGGLSNSESTEAKRSPTLNIRCYATRAEICMVLRV